MINTFDWDVARRELEVGDKTYLDSETCGLHSMMVLLQYAVDDGPIHLYNIWLEPVWKTLRLLEAVANTSVILFNGAFDWFHVAKIYTIWRLLPGDWIPVEHIEEIALIEPQGQDGPCIKPRSSCDLLLWSRKNEFQTLMGRDDIRIRRVPTALAYALAEELEKRVEIDGIFFARSKDKDAPRWRVYDIKKGDEIVEDFKDVVLKFNPAGGLKFLAEYALGYTPKYHFEDVELDKEHRPYELGYAPTALAVSCPEHDWEVWGIEDGKEKLLGHAWPAKVEIHIDHWANNGPAREYASDDIVYTRELYKHFKSPEPDDDDSVLACMVAAIRWHGYNINVPGITNLRHASQAIVDEAPINVNKPTAVREYLSEVMDDTEAMFIEDTTEKAKLEAIENWFIDDEGEDCIACFGDAGGDCKRCGGSGRMEGGLHPAARRAKELLKVKKAKKEVELFDKLLKAGKFHASFRVIGSLSSRMSGGDGLNPQGIKKTKEVRSQFPFVWGDDYELCGGDFDAFEVTLAEAVYADPQLRAALQSGKKIHGLFGMAMFPGKTYEEILASDGTDFDMYTMAKSGVFAMIYGGNADTLHRNLGIPIETANAAYEQWGKMFPGIAKARQRIFNSFCSMRQPGGIGSQVVWADPADYVESFLGDRRYFTLENRICKELFNLGNKPPKNWRDSSVKVVRRDRIQTASGAVASALYAAAFGIQAANMRAAANHEIQSPGARITKYTQRQIWDLQPAGVHEWVVAPMNIHDEILCVTRKDYVEPVGEKVRESVEHFRDRVALIGMTWNLAMANWAEKKGGSVTLKIKPPPSASSTSESTAA